MKGAEVVHIKVNGLNINLGDRATVKLNDFRSPCVVRSVEGDVFDISCKGSVTYIDVGNETNARTRLTLEGRVKPSLRSYSVHSFGGGCEYMVIPTRGDGIRIEQRGWTTCLYIGLFAGPRAHQPPPPVRHRPLWRRALGV